MGVADTIGGKEVTGDPGPVMAPLILTVLSALLIGTLLFTTLGIWMIDRFVLPLNDLQWTMLILVPWALFIIVLTSALVLQIIRGVLDPWRIVRK